MPQALYFVLVGVGVEGVVLHDMSETHLYFPDAFNLHLPRELHPPSFPHSPAVRFSQPRFFPFAQLRGSKLKSGLEFAEGLE